MKMRDLVTVVLQVVVYSYRFIKLDVLRIRPPPPPPIPPSTILTLIPIYSE